MTRAQKSNQTHPRSTDLHDKKAVVSLDPMEWDFRTVQESGLATAVLYEYTRSCARVRSTYEEWHNAPVDFAQLEESDIYHEVEPLLTTLRMIPGATNADAIEHTFDAKRCCVHLEAARAFQWCQWLLAPRASWPNSLLPIGLKFGNFSRSWPEMQLKLDPEYLFVRLLPPVPRKTGILPDFGPKWNAKLLSRRNPTLRCVKLMIDFSTPVDDLTKEFRSWVIANRPDIPVESQRLRGRPARWERLKWLAAFRMAEAGYDYKSAREAVIQRQKAPKLDVKHDVLPLYASPGAWSDAVTKARDELAGDFTQSILQSFGYSGVYLH